MKPFASFRLITVVPLLFIVAILTLLSCSDQGKPSNPPGNQPPGVPQLVKPANGTTACLDTLCFAWNYSVPDGDSISYKLYLGNSPDLVWKFRNIPHTFQPSAWLLRAKMKEFLGQVYSLQSAYHREDDAYCLNSETATYGFDSFAPIGAVVDSLNGYIYAMNAGANTFTCTATANLDDDATLDTWTINQDSIMVCTIDDFETLKSPASIYYWRVGAEDNHGHISLSPIWTFTTP